MAEPTDNRAPEDARPHGWADAFYVGLAAACVAMLIAVALRGSMAEGVRTGGGSPFREATGPAIAPEHRQGRLPFTRPDVPKIPRAEVEEKGLSLTAARFWSAVEGNEVQCELCPTLCRLRDGERGQCRVRVNYSGKLYALTYGKLVAEHLDPIEKKPLNHFLPASRVYSIATAGCNLTCVFCQNWQISQAFPEAAPFQDRPPADAVQMAIRTKCPSIAYTYTEPSVFYEYMYDCAKLAREKGIANVWVTCGYLNEKPLRELAQYLDAANVDVKGFSDEFYAKWCGGQLAPVLRTIEVLKEMKVHIEITNLLVPGGNDDPDMIRGLCRWLVKNVGPQVPIHFTRYHPDYKLERPGPTPLSTLKRAKEIAIAEGLKYVYVGNVAEPEGMDTVCAGCGRTLVARHVFYVKSNAVADGKCPDCGARIPGTWFGAAGGPKVRVPVDEPPPKKKG